MPNQDTTQFRNGEAAFALFDLKAVLQASGAYKKATDFPIKTTNAETESVTSWTNTCDVPVTPTKQQEKCETRDVSKIEGEISQETSSPRFFGDNVFKKVAIAGHSPLLMSGNYKGQPIYEIMTPVQERLLDAKVETPFGMRYLLNEPTNFVEWLKQEDNLNAPDHATTSDAMLGQSLTFSDSGDSDSHGSVNSVFSACLATSTSLGSIDSCLSATRPLQLFHNEYFEVRESPTAGLGAFAVKDLKKGVNILFESPLLKTSMASLFDTVDAMTALEQAAFYSLHGFSTKQGAAEAEKIVTANGFRTANGTLTIFPIASRFNHACHTSPDMNVKWLIDQQRNCIVMTICKPVSAGSELFISYVRSPYVLLDSFGFHCSCPNHADYRRKSQYW